MNKHDIKDTKILALENEVSEYLKDIDTKDRQIKTLKETVRALKSNKGHLLADDCCDCLLTPIVLKGDKKIYKNKIAQFLQVIANILG